MNYFVIYSRHDISRNWPENNAPVGTRCVDWYNDLERDALLEETGPLHVGLFPTVFVRTEAWTDYTQGLTDAVGIDAQWTPVYEPEDWDAVDVAIADYADRVVRGWASVNDIPVEENLIWTDPPEVSEGQVAVHAGWSETENGWMRVWRIVEVEGDTKDGSNE